MMILTVKHTYEILQKLKDDQTLKIMIAREEGRPENGKYLLVALKDPEYIYQFIPLCSKQKENVPFVDFIDYFPKDDCLYMVFQYYEYERLELRLQKRMPKLEERLKIAEHIIRQMIYLHIPDYLQYEALNVHNLVIDENNDIHFNYILTELLGFYHVASGEILLRLQQILRELFKPEIRDHSYPSLERFVNEVGEDRYGSYVDILKVFENICLELPSDRVNFPVWERIKGAAKYGKIVFYIIIAALLLVCLIGTIRHPPIQEGEPLDFHNIGTLTLEAAGEN